MSCKWCHESCPPKRVDGYCSEICREHYERVFPPSATVKPPAAEWPTGLGPPSEVGK